MPPPIISDTFEALEQLGSQTVKGAAQVPKKILEQGKQQLGIGAKDQGIEGGGTQTKGQSGQANAGQGQQIQKMESVAKQKALQRYKEVQEQILAIGKKRQQELPKDVTGKPGFSEDKMIKQLEEEKKPEAEKKKEQMAKEPLPMQREKRKAEMFRGAAG